MLAQLAAEAMDIDAHRGIQHHIEIGGLVENLLRDFDLFRRTPGERALEQEVEQPDQGLGPAEATALAHPRGFSSQSLPIVGVPGCHVSLLSVLMRRASVKHGIIPHPLVSLRGNASRNMYVTVPCWTRQSRLATRLSQ